MRPKQLGLALVACALVVGAAIGNRRGPGQGLAPLPAEPERAALELVDAQAFVLDEPFPHHWRAERPSFSAGYLLVLRADPDLLRPRQTAEPVLYVGDQTAERLNAGASGHLVCLVPADLDVNGEVALDPTTVPIWFGAPELPERVDARTIARERARALASGVGPLPHAPTLRRRAANETHYLPSIDHLDPLVADLVERWSPLETDRIAGLRVPLTR